MAENGKRISAVILSVLTLLLFARFAPAELVITEIMSQSALSTLDGDWWELTNTGPTAINLAGYSWDDNYQRIGQNVLPNITIASGESIIFLDEDRGNAQSFAGWVWILNDRGVKVYNLEDHLSGQFSSLGEPDGVFLYNPSGLLVASAEYTTRITGYSNAWDTSGRYLGISLPYTNSTFLGIAAGDQDAASPGFAVSDSCGGLTGMIYWTDKIRGEIRRLNLVGGRPEEVLSMAQGLNEPYGLALDPVHSKMYWADPGTQKIQRANLDGSNMHDVITGLSFPADLALDLVAGKIYWADRDANRIQRANLDGSGIENILTGITRPYYVALDLTAGKIYWSDFNSPDIHRANLDGSVIEIFSTGAAGQNRVRDMALDVSAGKIYWADRNASLIRRANLWDLSQREDLYTESDGLDRPHGLVLDKRTGKIYWTDTAMMVVMKGNMDGSEPPMPLVFAHVQSPWAVALIPSAPDFDINGSIDLGDLAILLEHWLEVDCNWQTCWCGGANLCGDGKVNLNDFAKFAEHWL